jgi:hypothetical protein
MTTNMKPVSKEARFMRARRALARQNKDLCKCRSVDFLDVVGRYFMIDLTDNSVCKTHVSLDDLTQELKLLKPFEMVVE